MKRGNGDVEPFIVAELQDVKQGRRNCATGMVLDATYFIPRNEDMDDYLLNMFHNMLRSSHSEQRWKGTTWICLGVNIGNPLLSGKRTNIAQILHKDWHPWWTNTTIEKQFGLKTNLDRSGRHSDFREPVIEIPWMVCSSAKCKFEFYKGVQPD